MEVMVVLIRERTNCNLNDMNEGEKKRGKENIEKGESGKNRERGGEKKKEEGRGGTSSSLGSR